MRSVGMVRGFLRPVSAGVVLLTLVSCVYGVGAWAGRVTVGGRVGDRVESGAAGPVGDRRDRDRRGSNGDKLGSPAWRVMRIVDQA